MIEDIRLSVAWATFLSLFQKVAHYFKQYHVDRLRYNYALDPPQMVYSLIASPVSRNASDVHLRASANSTFVFEALQLIALSFLVGTMMTLARCMQKAGELLHRNGLDLPLMRFRSRSIGHKLPQRSANRRLESRSGTAPCMSAQNTRADITGPADAACEYPCSISAADPHLALVVRAPRALAAAPDDGRLFSCADELDDDLNDPENSMAEYYGVSHQFAESDIFDLGSLSVRLSSIRSLGINNSPTARAAKASGMLIW
ncbi:AaceriAGR033Wp [[Ashbya] aceris (nom. inval.)]|nr:AaceriAGR033Wp [[Ashbya] aceris (nom. inval.)]